MGYGAKTCLDSPARKNDLHKPAGLYPCHGQGGNQVCFQKFQLVAATSQHLACSRHRAAHHHSCMWSTSKTACPRTVIPVFFPLNSSSQFLFFRVSDHLCWNHVLYSVWNRSASFSETRTPPLPVFDSIGSSTNDILQPRSPHHFFFIKFWKLMHSCVFLWRSGKKWGIRNVPWLGSIRGGVSQALERVAMPRRRGKSGNRVCQPHFTSRCPEFILGCMAGPVDWLLSVKWWNGILCFTFSFHLALAIVTFKVFLPNQIGRVIIIYLQWVNVRDSETVLIWLLIYH